MAYYVTGFYKDDKEAGYYIFDSNTNNTVMLNNKRIRDNKTIIRDTANARFSGYNVLSKPILTAKKTDDNIQLEYKPAIIEEGKLIENNQTLVFIDFDKRKYGVVSFNGENITWYGLDKLSDLDKDNTYNNLAYIKDTGILDLKFYHITGQDKQYDIKLNNIVVENIVQEDTIIQPEEAKVQVKDTTDSDIYVNFSEVGLIPNNIEEEVKEIEEPTDSEKDSQELVNELTANSESYTNKKLRVTQKNFYESMLLMLRDEDIVTLPKWIVKELKFNIKANLESSSEVDKRVSIGTIEISNHTMIAIIRFNGSLDYINLQMAMSNNIEENKAYSIEIIKENYAKWRKNKRYLTL